jgi:hypothetical protein
MIVRNKGEEDGVSPVMRAVIASSRVVTAG